MSRWATLWERLRRKDVSVALGGRDETGAPICSNCVFFRNDPADMEAALPGLPGLSSAFGSARSDDGLCLKHDRFVTVQATCGAFRRTAAERRRS